MWKDYSAGFIRKNRASSISIMVAAFISALFLSLVCSLFYNSWTYEIEKITVEEGDWQGRITGEISENDLNTIQNFANVEKAVVKEKLSETETVVDVYFQNTRTIYQDMPLIVEKLGLDDSAATYHELLLSRYMIHNPQDEEPPLLMTFYLVILSVVSLSLILIILCGVYECKDSPVWDFFKHWSHTETDSHLFDAGGSSALRGADSVWKFHWHCN